MSSDPTVANVKQAVPFFHVTDMDASLRFYVEGLGCVLTEHRGCHRSWGRSLPPSPRLR